MIAVSLLQYSLNLISVMFVGHLGELILSSASIATSFAPATGFTFIPLSLIWANTTPILIALRQQKDISEGAGAYVKFMIPGLFAYGILQCLVKFLQTQSIVFPMQLSSAAVTLLHILLCWVFVFKLGTGPRGAAISISVSNWINVLLLSLYVKFSPLCAETWTGFSNEAFSDVWSFLKLAIPSAFMVCLELWCFEMLVLGAGLLPNPKLETSVLSICLNTALTLWMIPYGLGAAASTRVSNELGAGNPDRARLAVRIVVGMVVLEGILVGGILFSIRTVWGSVYSNDKSVINTTRGCGYQKFGAYINLGSYYLVGISCGFLFTFRLHIGGKGLYLGLICALLVQAFSLCIITIRTNWKQEAKKASDRVYDTTIPREQTS
ncbi:Protein DETOXIFICATION 16 [Linum grandiflorum]